VEKLKYTPTWREIKIVGGDEKGDISSFLVEEGIFYKRRFQEMFCRRWYSPGRYRRNLLTAILISYTMKNYLIRNSQITSYSTTQ